MKRIILTISGVALIVLLSTIYIFNFGLNSDVSDENIIFYQADEQTSSILFSEIPLTQNELINQSDLIVRCKFSGHKNKRNVTAKTSEGHVTIYKMKSVESLKGTCNKYFELGMFGDGDKALETDDEFILFLCKSPDGVYGMVSYSQGINIIRQRNTDSMNTISNSEDTSEFKSIETNTVINLKELKNRIKQLER